ncbi:serine carboxypeptidase-like 50 [Humulus lupulus]|uniref:serine carboxypeptidase-like 50 n=1 Tax=Humulus lupulus TaxID=3486 RepID=UPI002B4106DB|nr:serine carboxypeptidase-like 50 [Humulus lupulus]
MEPRSTTARHNLLKPILLLLLFFFFCLWFFFFNFSAMVTPQEPDLSQHHPVTRVEFPAQPFPKQALPTKSGYLPVNFSSGSAIFYAFYEAHNPISSLSQTPLLIWLQGGPGCSSMYGNFLEFGPWRVSSAHPKSKSSYVLESNPAAWNRIFGVLFLDNPIGSGYSIAARNEDIPRDVNSVAKHLYMAILQFLELDPTLFKSRPVYIAGESYAGKYVPAIGYHIMKKNAYLPKTRRINFGGVAIGNGLIDPVVQVGTHASHAYFTGLINEQQKEEIERLQSRAIELAKKKRWRESTDARYRVVDYLQSTTGLATLYDFTKIGPYNIGIVTDFLQSDGVKAALKVKESAVTFINGCNDDVKEALHDDTMKSVKYMVEFLVRKSKVLLYQGQYDLWDGVVSTEAWVRSMDWEEIGKFLLAERIVWKDENGGLAGYVQKWKSLSNVVVFGAGHLVPTDQPLNSRRMIEDWVLDRGFFADVNDLDSNFILDPAVSSKFDA